MTKKLVVFLLLLLLTSSGIAVAATRHVRTDGGTGTECTGLTNAAYPGSGTAQNCAVNHPNWLLPPTGSASSFSTARQAGANDLIVIGPGSYRMGMPSASGFDSNININCPTGDTASCVSGVIPNGATVRGCTTIGCGCITGWGGLVTCTTQRPELWGAGNTLGILNATGSSSVVIEDIEITDHSNNGYAYTGNTGTYPNTCGSNSNPSSLCGYVGILAHSASNLTVRNTWVHGLGKQGLFAASLANPTFIGFTNEYNAEIGINNDTTSSCSTCGWTGTITFDKSRVSWTGCIEDWQNDGQIVPLGCYGTEYGGYGDGFGLARTGGIWVITDSDISHNVSDGLDLLYLNKPPYSGGSVTIKRSRFEGNSGNQVKVPNAAIIEDNQIIGNCAYFVNQPISRLIGGDICRGAGAPVEISIKEFTVKPVVQSNTITSNGDTLFGIEVEPGVTCVPGLQFLVRNNILVGGRDAIQDTSIGFVDGQNDFIDLYYDGSCTTAPVFNNNLCVGMFKGSTAPECGATNTVISAANQNNLNVAGAIRQGGVTTEGVPGTGIAAYATYTTEPESYADNFTLLVTSPAINGANTSFGDSFDVNTYDRGATWDIGALEYGSTGAEPICGNNIVEGSEVCDGTDLAGETCVSQGFGGGTLACNAGCGSLNTSGCSNPTTGLIQHRSNFLSSNATSINTTTAATGSGNLLVAVFTSSTITNVSDGVSSFTKYPTSIGSVWYLPSSNAGRTTITATLPSGITSMEVWEVQGFTKPIPDLYTAVSSGTVSGGFSTGGAVLPTHIDDFIVAYVDSNGTATLKPGNHFSSGGDNLANGVSYQAVMATNIKTYQPVWTDSGTTFVSLTVAFKEGAPGVISETTGSSIGGNSSL